MRKWGPWVAMAVVLGSLFVWSQCSPPASTFGPVTESSLQKLAGKTLGPPAEFGEWSASRMAAFDIGELSQEAQQLANKLGEKEFQGTPQLLAEFTGALAKEDTRVSREGGFRDWVFAKLVLCRLQLGEGAVTDATANLTSAASESVRAIATASSVEEWQQAQIARLWFLEAVPAVLADPRWGSELRRAVAAVDAPAGHRATLGRIFQARFEKSVIPSIAKASESHDLPGVVVAELYPDPAGDEAELVSAMLLRHPRAFSPEETLEAGAESIKQLQTAMAESWPKTRTVLDKATEAQAFWTDFIKLLELGEDEAKKKVVELKTRIDSLQNPVGLALLHHERLSWSSLVQSAFVADAREVAFVLGLDRLLGKVDRDLVDPFSGGDLELEGGALQFASDGKDDAYPFIKAFTSAPVSY